MKRCSKCKEEKSLEEFRICNSTKCNRTSACKACLNKAQNEKRLDPVVLERYQQSSRKFRILNREKYLLRCCKTRSREKGLEFTISVEDIVIPEFCPILGVKLTRDSIGGKDLYVPSVDRIDNTKGYIKGNVQVISLKANVMKSSANNDELLAFCKYFLDDNRQFRSDRKAS